MPVFILITVLLLLLGSGVAIWFVFRQRQAIKSKEPIKQNTTRATLTFRRSYIMLPVVFLLLSIILTAYFYRLLPAEVAYRFQADGSPNNWLSRSAIILWALWPQLFLALLAGTVTWGITRLSALFRQSESTRIKPESIISLMGNMIVLPQIIIFFTMLDIFSYNSYQIHLLPLWALALIILGLGSIILGICFIRIIRQAWGVSR